MTQTDFRARIDKIPDEQIIKMVRQALYGGKVQVDCECGSVVFRSVHIRNPLCLDCANDKRNATLRAKYAEGR